LVWIADIKHVFRWSRIFLFTLIVCGCQSEQKEKLTIAVAANMQYAIQELSEAFALQTGIACNVIIGSSGALTAQITQGAPFDVFVAADLKYPNQLFDKGLAIGDPQVYAYGTLVLWSMNTHLDLSIDGLVQKDVRHIAIANPKTAPYGMATEEVLHHNEIYTAVKEKLVFGESIAQTNQFIMSGSADVGFTAKAVVMSEMMKNKGQWKDIDKDTYTEMPQAMIVLKGSEDQRENAKKFTTFMVSTVAKEILNTYGYGTLDHQNTD